MFFMASSAIYFFYHTSKTPKKEEIGEKTAKEKINETAPEYKKVITTLFWVGETSDKSNGFIPNNKSYWDSEWLKHYGGIDDPQDRCGNYPCGFRPKENPFYFALPYGERDNAGGLKESARLIPWYKETPKNESILKNTWIEIKNGRKICYAQWQDVGPFETDDFDYVFGKSAPKNTFGVSAGLDVSPAVWDCLGMKDNAVTEWRFIEKSKVPDGPWKLIETYSGISF